MFVLGLTTAALVAAQTTLIAPDVFSSQTSFEDAFSYGYVSATQTECPRNNPVACSEYRLIRLAYVTSPGTAMSIMALLAWTPPNAPCPPTAP